MNIRKLLIEKTILYFRYWKIRKFNSKYLSLENSIEKYKLKCCIEFIEFVEFIAFIEFIEFIEFVITRMIFT